MTKHTLLFAIVLGVAAIGCDSDSSPVAEAPPATEPATDGAPPVTGAELQEKLMLADMADGVDDKTVTKCATCQLVMNGTEAHAVEYEGYQFHLCSPTCEKLFAGDPAAAVTKLTVEPTSTTGP